MDPKMNPMMFEKSSASCSIDFFLLHTNYSCCFGSTRRRMSEAATLQAKEVVKAEETFACFFNLLLARDLFLALL